MHATLTLFTIKPGMREKIEKVADVQFSALRGMKGFKSATFFVNPDESECGGFMVYESKEDAEAAWAVSESKMKEAMSEIAEGPPKHSVFEVYEPIT